MTFFLSSVSRKKLAGVHPDLVKVVNLAIDLTAIDFAVIEGLRTLDREKEMVAEGKSETLHSMHLPQKDGYSHAVDVAAWVNGRITWDAEYYEKIADSFFQASSELKVPITWGGMWSSLADLDHFELDQKFYNDN